MPSNHADAIRSLLSPRAIALYGASDKSNWSHAIYASTRFYGFDGPMYAINRQGVSAHGLPGYKACREILGQVDIAYVYVPTASVPEAFKDIAAAGIRSAVVLSSGFADDGEEGQRRQDDLVALARRLNITFLGPNSMGFANIGNKCAVAAMRPVAPYPPGKLALVSQSGALCYQIMEYALQQGVGLSFAAAIGNEAMLDMADMIDVLLDDDAHQAIACYVEAIRSPERMIAVARKALALRKPIVMLKAGTSEVSAAIAQAHTGSLIGDDRVLEAVCRQFGIVRVSTLEGLINTSALLIHTGVIERPGMAVTSLSGGVCSLIADAADREGCAIPPFSDATVAALKEILPAFAGTLNPLDVTGVAFNDPELWGKVLRIVSRDPNVGLTIAAGALYPMGAVTPQVGVALTELGSKGILLSPLQQPVEPALCAKLGIPRAFAGIEDMMAAVAAAMRWSHQVLLPKPPLRAAATVVVDERPATERAVLAHLERFGVPVIPAVVVISAEAAVAAADHIGGNVFALKIASPDIQHKSDAGGVLLKIEAGEPVAKAYGQIMASVAAARPDAKVDGVIVSPMRSAGIELIVGTINDPDWGPAIVVGMGGVWVELMDDSALHLLPVKQADVIRMLRGLKAFRLLDGYRGTTPASLERLADAIVAIGDAALALGPDLATLEVNPLLVDGDRIEALDGLALYGAQSLEGTLEKAVAEPVA